MLSAPLSTPLVVDGHQQLGRFAGPPAINNLLDAPYRGLPRVLRALRLKEWHAVQLETPELFVNVALFDAKLMSLLQVKVYERALGRKHVHERTLPPHAFKLADQLYDSRSGYADRRSLLEFRNRVAQGRLDVLLELAATERAPAMRGALCLHVNEGASHFASLPLPHAGMCSHKGMFPVSGTLTVGAITHTLRTSDCLALLDDHKGYYPYVMEWDWLTSATVDAQGRRLGFNLTRNQCPQPERWNENCVWIDQQVGTLPAVTFEREREGAPGERWHVRDREGRVQLRFSPTLAGDVRVQALIVESRYRGPFGTLHGTLEAEGLPALTIDGWLAMGERFWLRC